MDLSLVLTHRCNLACDYCYAGAHCRRDMDAETLAQAMTLLYADGEEEATLSFFGGEPFLAFDTMQRAIELAEAQARERGKALSVQCTTNGTRMGPAQVALIQRTRMHVTVSIDGVREAHEMHRPLAGGRSSYDQVLGGLRALIAADVDVEAMMVITPETAAWAFRSVCLLWDEGVHIVRANLELKSGWTRDDREELGRELVAIGREQLARTLRGRPVSFQPFDVGMRLQREGAPSGCSAGHRGTKRAQIVVGTTGHLYPCAPMVGEDRDDGPEAALRIGHVKDGPEAVVERIAQRGAGCADGTGCACAAYLETGDRDSGGPLGLWYARACSEIGRATQAALDCHDVRTALDASPELGDDERATEPPKKRRRWIYVGAGLGVAAGSWAAFHTLMAPAATAGALSYPPDALPSNVRVEPLPVVKPITLPPQPSVLGQMARPVIRIQPPGGVGAPPLAPPPPRVVPRLGRGSAGSGVVKAPPPRRRQMITKGDVAAPPSRALVDGDLAAPPPPRTKPPKR